jgi:pyruvate formate-lyase/glycerol dehydratase family glycyl radical enzyme
VQMNKNTHVMSTQRTIALKEAIQAAPREVSTVRGRIFTEVFKRNENTPLLVKRTLAYRTLLEDIPIRIYENELLVGGITEKRKGAFLSPETSIEGMALGGRLNQPTKKAIAMAVSGTARLVSKVSQVWGKRLSSANLLLSMKLDNPENRPGPSQRFRIGDIEKVDITRTILPYWKKRNAYTRYRPSLSIEEKKLMSQFAYAAEHAFVGGVFLFHPNIEDTMRKGLNATIRQAEELQSRVPTDLPNAAEQIGFYGALADSCRAVIAFANRYADLAESMARETDSSERRTDLLRIAEICRHVPANPPRTFHEGLQSLWFIYIAVLNDDCGHEVPFGRWDQALFPLYQQDLEHGHITKEEALELIECYVLKANEIEFLLPNSASFFEDGNSGRITLTIGGVDRSGEDGTNEVSYLFLQALSNCRMIRPNPAVRLHKGTPDDFLELVVRIMGSGANTVQIFNDETVIQGFTDNHIPLGDARDYLISGCVQQIPAATYGSVCAAHLVLPRTLELFLQKNHKYHSYQDFYESYTGYLAHIIKQATITLSKVDKTHQELLPNAFVSALVDGPMQHGRDVKSGGAKHNLTGISLLGLGTLADSLVAVRTAVFEERVYTLEQLQSILRRNFAGRESDRLYLANKIPKFGNDDDRVDLVAKDLASFCASEVERYTTFRGGRFCIGVHSENGQVVFGYVTGATPDGRKMLEPYSIGASSARGRERNGYTATLKSVSKLDCSKVTAGISVNLRFNPSLFDSDNKIQRFKDLIRAYFFDYGGQNLQTTVVDIKTLQRAQEHPEEFQDLLVRISGYSARFVELTKQTQDEIVSRTEYSV